MADYGKIEVKATYSKKSDFSSPRVTFEPDDYNPTTGPDEYDVYLVDTTATVNTTKYDSIMAVVVKNNDATNSVTVAFQNAAASAQSQVLAAGKVAVFPDVLASANLTLTASSGTIECEVFVMGS